MEARASASGKIILLGEHAVVYGRPAIAAPVTGVKAWATVEDSPGEIFIRAPDIGKEFYLEEASPDDPLRLVVELTLKRLELGKAYGFTITIHSEIPIARGLGSGAAVSTAIVRALSLYFQRKLTPDEISAIVYETEKIYHGTPSGIDNTVIAYEMPVFFVKGQPPVPFKAGRTLTFIIGDTGIPSPTRDVVLWVRKRWEEDRARCERLFDQIGSIVLEGKEAIERGELRRIGELMDENHRLLAELGVSSPELDRLVDAAREAGALGAKLSGAGWGGNMIALVEDWTVPIVSGALKKAGAVSLLTGQVS
ncbi:MAG: mevalonate kinase [Anaerolineae bacterium]|nr:mevalonate kinase [Anaerolineae bacterium]MDW8102213.1 mevalonate kinase [Anaerolineae bacterium]